MIRQQRIIQGNRVVYQIQIAKPQQPKREELTTEDFTKDLVKWLREVWQDEKAAERMYPVDTSPADDVPVETSGFDPFDFQLVNGNQVRVVFAQFWDKLSYQDLREGARPTQYHAIKVYSTEGRLHRSMGVYCEFRAHHDFSLTALPKIWDWLEELMETRRYIQYDWLDEFVDELTDHIIQCAGEGEDAVEHYDQIASLIDPDVYDHDDSYFNDQDDDDVERRSRDRDGQT